MNLKPPIEIKQLADFLGPFSKGIGMSGDKELSAKLERSAFWLDKLSRYICGAGYIGCHGGPTCDSDHK